MDAQRDEFIKTLERFEQRAKRLSPLALHDPIEDADERAAMTLLMSSAFESFLRDVTRACVEDVPGRVGDFADLPKAIKRAHYEHGADVLRRAARRDWAEVKAGRAVRFLTAEDVATRLSSAGGSSYSLVWEGFAQTESNADPEVVKKILARLDVSKPWETLESHVPTSAYPDPPPGPVRAGKLNAVLSALRDARNRCAHGASSAAAPPWSTLLEAVEALRAVAMGMVTALHARLAKL